ncbi:multicopper oxidase family protein [Microvirga sp. VF16]|uniref:multicopper oxidase family protein n=1 Tax=Microvirga sp. VF16 TaxID=2807101 RepID=UPI00193E39E8|nr:multicopper oxidase family protein [Microvirga sp. VF16]QRM34698.1 multicopper oxidase family protein [Microvirga sp. VF16]
MSQYSRPGLSRRSILAGSAGLALATALPRGARALVPALKEYRLNAAPAQVPLVGASRAETQVWAYHGQVPGPEIRVRQGERVRVLIENRLPEETTVHWHGVRVPNPMDGVPQLTQPPIGVGETFAYEFDCLDAGTFWYHPHQRSFAQAGRGLYGPFIVEENEPYPVDRDVTWMLGDWRLLKDGSISDDFGNLHDVSHAGRIGNTVTVNGLVREAFEVRAGERIRLRLINAANARIFGLTFEGHSPMVVALDGHPVEPHEPAGGQVVLGPAMRVDLVLDMTGRPGSRFKVVDSFYKGLEYQLLELSYTGEPLREVRATPVPRLPANPVREPDLSSARRHEVTLGGGMMGMMTGAMVHGDLMDIRSMLRQGLVWAINGVAATGHVHEPMATLAHGSSHVLAIANETAWWHPMHLHGHTFRVLSRNGVPTRYREWQDTVLIPPRERVEIGFAADNPGDWMFHCHVLEHQAGGMMGTIRVASA